MLLQSAHESPTLFCQFPYAVIHCLLWLWCNVRLEKGTTTTNARPRQRWIYLGHLQKIDRFAWPAGIFSLGMRAAHTHGELARVLHGTTTTTDDRRCKCCIFPNVTAYVGSRVLYLVYFKSKWRIGMHPGNASKSQLASFFLAMPFDLKLVDVVRLSAPAAATIDFTMIRTKECMQRASQYQSKKD